MKHYKRLNEYKASNVKFDIGTNIATSYNWWQFVKPIGGKLVFNNYSYSNSTCKHQSKVSRLLDDLGLTIDIVVNAPKGLQDLQEAFWYNAHDLVDSIGKYTRARKHKEYHKSKATEAKEALLFISSQVNVSNESKELAKKAISLYNATYGKIIDKMRLKMQEVE